MREYFKYLILKVFIGKSLKETSEFFLRLLPVISFRRLPDDARGRAKSLAGTLSLFSFSLALLTSSSATMTRWTTRLRSGNHSCSYKTTRLLDHRGLGLATTWYRRRISEFYKTRNCRVGGPDQSACGSDHFGHHDSHPYSLM